MKPLTLATLALALLPATSFAAPQPMTRDDIIGLAKKAVGYSYWWGHGRWRSDGAQHGSCSGSCPSCSHSGSYGADCSGLAGKVWQVPSPSPIDTDSHPYSTYNFRNQTTHWDRIDRKDLKKGDALVYNNGSAGHIVVYESGDGWGSHWVYECKGCSYGCVHNVRTSGSDYIGIRRHLINDRPALDAAFVGQGANVGADPEGKAQLKACTGQKLQYWFELRDTGSASWVDWDANGTGTGQRVRLGVPTDTADPIAGVGRITLSKNANPDVHPATWSPPGGDCNDQAFCQRTVFRIEGTAPAKPGVYKSEWRLVDEGRAWFGPGMYLTFNVVDCAPPAGADAGTPPAPPAPPVAAPDAAAPAALVPAPDAGVAEPPADHEVPVSVVPAPGEAKADTAQMVGAGCASAPGTERADWVALTGLLALLAIGSRRSSR